MTKLSSIEVKRQMWLILLCLGMLTWGGSHITISAAEGALAKFSTTEVDFGRVPINVSLNELTEDDMIRILREPKNSLTKQYQALFKMDGVKLEFEEDALREIAKKSIERKTGARGLRAIVESVMMDYMYHVPSDETITEIHVTKEMVDNNLLLIDKESNDNSVVSIEDTQEKSA